MRDIADLLFNPPDVVATLHIGYVTQEEFDLQFSAVFDQINSFGAGILINMINPAALELAIRPPQDAV